MLGFSYDTFLNIRKNIPPPLLSFRMQLFFLTVSVSWVPHCINSVALRQNYLVSRENYVNIQAHSYWVMQSCRREYSRHRGNRKHFTEPSKWNSEENIRSMKCVSSQITYDLNKSHRYKLWYNTPFWVSWMWKKFPEAFILLVEVCNSNTRAFKDGRKSW